MTTQQLEAAILSDVVTRFANMKESTSRRALLIKFRGQPAWQAITNLTNQSLIQLKSPTATQDEEYLPTATAFQFCGNEQFRNQAKLALEVVLHALQEMYVGEQKKDGFVFEDLKRHVEAIYTDRSFDDETLKLGLYLAQYFGVLAGSRLNEPARTEVIWFQVGESAIGMTDPETEWDRVMTGSRQPIAVSIADTNQTEKAVQANGGVQWERIRSLGSGGQSEVFLVRSPSRASERADCLQKIRKALDEDRRAELAEAIYAYARTESPPEQGALKLFKIPPEGDIATPAGSSHYEAIERLKNEVTVLSQGRPGLPGLVDSNIKERWIVTEYFPQGTLEQDSLRFKGNATSALNAFQSLVRTVASLHKDGYVHRDIKPSNLFIRENDELVLGDFGIVYVPTAAERVTLTGERVGPRDYMPQWAHLGSRYEMVEPCFDVYMLGKLLWSMVDGRMFLPREYHHRPEFDLTKTFPNDPDMFLIDRILDKCVVEDSKQCLSSAQELLLVVDEILGIVARCGQLLSHEVPRPCHVCGKGFYQPHSLQANRSSGTLRVWMSGQGSDIAHVSVQIFTCNNCGRVELFATK